MSSRFLVISFAISALFFTSACKKDATPPVITLTGGSQIELPSGVPATDPGATANDDKDGDISSRIKSDWESVVDTDVEGTYLVTYTAMDNNRNQGTAERTVIVKFGTASLFGAYEVSYSTSGDPLSYTLTTSISAGSGPDQFVINPFLPNTLESIQVKFNALTSQLLVNQKEGGITYYGPGTVNNKGKTITLNFTAYGGGSSTAYTYNLARK